ncbi:hypothetical protein [Nostoc sp. 'Peltigera membranacea cyanobiont' N6]|uniref:hypothetical protein n=1 Tax=Nostoc sp. 'Peltigera membranacea cyanobiont' N6 TaxID=1261031 RepID=UPI000CF33098|nr:hypothetical protein [Nostoc sp. 'Peltigera membranacea cyanobiont' N6]AVH66184.1 hypothetical protein NPM_4667 [Nostoc sp. 'Peltigera membranacea cyanobiont' N6]
MSIKQTSFKQKIITGLLIAKLTLIGVQAENRIQQGDSSTEILIWVISQCVPVLLHIERLEKEQNKNKYK